MKRRHLLNNNIDCKRFKLGKCPYCNNNIYISDISHPFKNKHIRLTCNHYSHINCINRFLQRNTYCHMCSKKSSEQSLNQKFKNLHISINFYTT